MPRGRCAGDVYEEELQIEIKNGLVESSRICDNRVEFHEARIEFDEVKRRLQELMEKLKGGGGGDSDSTAG